MVSKAAFGTVRRLASGRYQARGTAAGCQTPIAPCDTELRASGDCVEAWWATRVGHRPSTCVREKGIIDHTTVPALRHRRLAEVSTAVVEGWVNNQAARLAP